jgi:hypothetical protein
MRHAATQRQKAPQIRDKNNEQQIEEPLNSPIPPVAVRCLFKFANGRKLDSRRAGFRDEERPRRNAPAGFTDHEILELHTANCAGENKRTWEGRLQWVKENRVAD